MNQDIVSSVEGEPGSGMRISLKECQYEWMWLFRQKISVLDANKSTIFVVPHSPTVVAQFTSCEGDHQTFGACACEFYVNSDPYLDEECSMFNGGPHCTCPNTGNRATSWGAIKTLFQ